MQGSFDFEKIARKPQAQDNKKRPHGKPSRAYELARKNKRQGD